MCFEFQQAATTKKVRKKPLSPRENEENTTTGEHGSQTVLAGNLSRQPSKLDPNGVRDTEAVNREGRPYRTISKASNKNGRNSHSNLEEASGALLKR